MTQWVENSFTSIGFICFQLIDNAFNEVGIITIFKSELNHFKH